VGLLGLGRTRGLGVGGRIGRWMEQAGCAPNRSIDRPIDRLPNTTELTDCMHAWWYWPSQSTELNTSDARTKTRGWFLFRNSGRRSAEPSASTTVCTKDRRAWRRGMPVSSNRKLVGGLLPMVMCVWV
jgi:hypothetical protein